MITVMVITDSIKNNEMISSSIIGGFENTACIIAATDISECEQIIRSQKHDIDIFIIQIRMKEKGGRKLAEFIRGFKRYKETPILFITSISQNVVGYSELATYQGYKKENYISTPIRRIDVQGKIGLYLDKIIEDAAEKRNCERVVFLEHDAGETFIEVKSILFAEVQNRTVTLHTESGDYSIGSLNLIRRLVIQLFMRAPFVVKNDEFFDTFLEFTFRTVTASAKFLFFQRSKEVFYDCVVVGSVCSGK